MIRNMLYKLPVGMVSALSFISLAGSIRAQVSTPTVTLMNGTYHYDYAIANATSDDLFDVSIHVLTGSDKVFNVSAPSGFVSAYDSGLGLVDYVEDTGLFTATPLGGFTYDSHLAPQTSLFDANRVNLSSGSIITTTDITLAAVPEPGSMALFGSLSAAACFAVRRRRTRSR